ncbi:hypothetical protein [Mesorhizobium sp.]|uniref:hypothetical protein n=1 Tax=Mesorhizobium sp. TaxID=1871066 RepID=UPI00257AAFB9|nr:hypothetical protein [Mesorhizobium sp.]
MEQDNVFYVGVDVSKAKHAVAIAEGGRGGEVRYFGEAFPARRHRNIVAVKPNRDGPVIVNKRHLAIVIVSHGLAEDQGLFERRIRTSWRRARGRQAGFRAHGRARHGRYVGSAFIPLNRELRERLWKRVQEHAGAPPNGMKRPATQWVKPVLIGRVKHLRGEENLRHASLQDFREED